MRISKSHSFVSVFVLAAGLATGCSDETGETVDDITTGGAKSAGDGEAMATATATATEQAVSPAAMVMAR